MDQWEPVECILGSLLGTFSVTHVPVSSSWFTMGHEIELLWARSRKTELHDYSNSNIYHDSHRHLWVPSCRWKHSFVATRSCKGSWHVWDLGSNMSQTWALSFHSSNPSDVGLSLIFPGYNLHCTQRTRQNYHVTELEKRKNCYQQEGSKWNTTSSMLWFVYSLFPKDLWITWWHQEVVRSSRSKSLVCFPWKGLMTSHGTPVLLGNQVVIKWNHFLVLFCICPFLFLILCYIVTCEEDPFQDQI